jgi:hypothetical protein
MYDWTQKWHELRLKCLRFIRGLATRYEDAYRGKSFILADVLPLADDIFALEIQTRSLPSRLDKQFVSQQRSIQDWSTSLTNFARQYFEHDPTKTQSHQYSLMCHNLKDALKKLPTMHKAFAEILRLEPDHFGMEALNERECDAYSYLVDILDYWPSHQLPVSDLRRSVDDFREAKRQAFSAEVRKTLKPLEDAGLRFAYPSGPWNDQPLVNLCVGYEMLDSSQHVEQVDAIGFAIGSAKLGYDFLCLVPMVRGHPFSPAATRVSRDTLQRMLAGEEIKGGVYPVRPPQALYEVLPDVNPEPLPDLALALRTGEVFVHLLMERNRLHFARTRLDCNVKEELRLLDRYEQRAIQQVEKSVGVCTKLIPIPSPKLG